jgi:hypothetical protein
MKELEMMKRKNIIFLLLVAIFLMVGCSKQIGGYEAASSISKNGFVRSPDSIGDMEGQEVQIWGYVDHGNIYGDDEVKEILGDWWSGEGPTTKSWQFNLKTKSNDKTGESFAVIIQTDDGRNDLLKAFLEDAIAQKATKVYLTGTLYTFDASTNLKLLTGLYLEIQSSSDILLEQP